MTIYKWITGPRMNALVLIAKFCLRVKIKPETASRNKTAMNKIDISHVRMKTRLKML
jgi:hypothetical protein